ncbi:MAG TPA: GDSL-type esterase/lipase family protein [Bryobacteraceae bacterium]|nr:GDSL-type esterase/lipase family protein [Bryobacteraceae bacterium]
MRFVWGRPALAVCLLVCAAAARAQQQPLGNKDAFELYGRAVQLMESASVAMPELARAGAPIAENARHAVATMRSLGRQHAGITYSFLGNARAFLLLADAIPKPDGFPQEAARQLAELRAAVDRAELNYRALLDSKEAQLRNPDRDNLARYAEANSKLPAPVAGRPRVVFLGDSITDGWRLNEYFPDRDFINRGISGQITGEMLGRTKADVLDLKPAAVLILAGTNDIARGVPLKAVEDNLAMIASLAEQHGIKPLLASVLPISDYHKDQNAAFEMSRNRPPQTIRALNDWIRALCSQRNYTYVDYFTPTVDSKGYLQTELSDDGLHPNSAGYRLMAPVALAAIDKAVAGSRTGKRGK